MEKNKISSLYTKNVICPVCQSEISVSLVRSSHIRINSRDTDLMYIYNTVNPLLYDVWVCEQCGYSALKTNFNDISTKQINEIKKTISSKWKVKSYGIEYNIDTAIERFKLALLSATIKKSKDSELATICLKIAWLYRLKKDSTNEVDFLSKSLNKYLQAFEIEHFPIAGMDEPSLTYLIGELYRRIGDNKDALIWYSRVLSHYSAKESIKEMARTQRQLIKAR